MPQTSRLPARSASAGKPSRRWRFGLVGLYPVILVSALCALAAGCQGGQAAPPPKTGWVPGTLRLGHHSDYRSLDPAIGFDADSIPLMRMIFQPLLDYDDDSQLVPLLAEAMPTLSKDGKTYTFHIRNGAKFSNDREVTAYDFLYSWKRVLDPRTKSPCASYIVDRIVGAHDFADGKAADVAGLRALDRYTLEVELGQPDLTFPYVVAMIFAAPVPREEIEKYKPEEQTDQFSRAPVGTGPLVLKEWRRNAHLRLERNPRYAPFLPQTQLDAIDVLIGLDDLTEQMMFERGELDLMDKIPAAAYVRLRKDPAWRPYLVSLTINETYFLTLNCELAPFDGDNGKKVRQALSYGVDRDHIVRVANGRGVVAKGVVPPNMPGYHSSFPGYPHDPEKAKQLLAEAGYPDGLSLTLWLYDETATVKRVGEAIQEDLKQSGVRVELNEVTYPVFLGATGKRKGVAFSLFGWTQDYPDPSDFLDVLFATKSITETDSNNASFYSNEAVDQLLDAADQETDPVHRLRLYEQAEDAIMDDAPVVCLYNPVEYWLHQPWVRGHKLHPVWLVRYETISISPP